ncbi:MAG: hypothetical protein IPK68_15595 [Bdellovibrionales bacterium]|nr:hypothetical protein [Bdellovibrionales bacterium]
MDDSGVVMNPGVHDAEILRIEIQGEELAKKSALISCRAENNEEFVIHIEGIHFFSMNFLISQNVISELYFLNKRDPGDFLSGIAELEKYTFNRYKTVADQIIAGTLSLVAVVPSVGCEFTAICEKAFLARV